MGGLALAACGETVPSSTSGDGGSHAPVVEGGMRDARGHDATEAGDATHTGRDGRADAPPSRDAAVDVAIDAPVVADAGVDASLDARLDADASFIPDAASVDAGIDAPVVSPWSADLASARFTTVAVDPEHNTLVGGAVTADAGYYPLFAKYDSTGALAWQKSLPGGGFTNGVATDANSHVAFVGTMSAPFDFGGGVLPPGGFVVEYDTHGNYVFAKTFPDVLFTIAPALNGGWVVAGTSSPSGGPVNAVLFGLDATGGNVFSKTFMSSGLAELTKVVVDGSGNLVVAGYFDGAFDLGGGALLDAGLSGQGASFVAVLDPAGNYLHEAIIHVAGEDLDWVGVGTSGDVYVAGFFTGTVNLGGGDVSAVGQSDAFLAKLDSSLGYLWGKSFGDPNGSVGLNAVAVDPAGDVVIVGSTVGTVDFGGGPLSSSAPEGQGYLAKFDEAGNHLASGILGATNDSFAFGVAAPTSGPSEVIVGMYGGTLDVGEGALAESASNGNAFVAWWVP
jgi:hypothetical protein